MEFGWKSKRILFWQNIWYENHIKHNLSTRNDFLGRYDFIIVTVAFWVTYEVTVLKSSLRTLSLLQGLEDLWVYTSEWIVNLKRAQCSFKTFLDAGPFKVSTTATTAFVAQVLSGQKRQKRHLRHIDEGVELAKDYGDGDKVYVTDKNVYYGSWSSRNKQWFILCIWILTTWLSKKIPSWLVW